MSDFVLTGATEEHVCIMCGEPIYEGNKCSMDETGEYFLCEDCTDDYVDDPIIALSIYLNVPVFDINEAKYDYYGAPLYTVGREEYAVISDDDIDDVFKAYARDYIDDCITIPNDIRPYFDEDKFIDDMRMDGYGIMASYDGDDNEQEYNDTLYHILRMN